MVLSFLSGTCRAWFLGLPCNKMVWFYLFTFLQKYVCRVYDLYRWRCVWVQKNCLRMSWYPRIFWHSWSSNKNILKIPEDHIYDFYYLWLQRGRRNLIFLVLDTSLRTTTIWTIGRLSQTRIHFLPIYPVWNTMFQHLFLYQPQQFKLVSLFYYFKKNLKAMFCEWRVKKICLWVKDGGEAGRSWNHLLVHSAGTPSLSSEEQSEQLMES